MIWIGYFFLGILLLLLFLICIRIKVELKLTKQEQWVEVRYLMLKYRFNLGEFLGQKEKTEDSKKDDKSKTAVTSTKKSNESRVKKKVATEIASHHRSTSKRSNEPKVNPASLKKTNDIYVEKSKEEEEIEIASERAKSKISWIKAPKVRQWLKVPKIRRWIKAPKVININFIRKININFLQFQYRRFKFIYKEGKVILYRLFAKIKIHQLESGLYFNVDDPVLNAHLIAIFWTVEANLYRFLQGHFKKVKGHKFDVKSQFSGNDIFLEMSCIVSFRVVDIIIVVLLSLKEILVIKRMIKIEKEV